MENKLEYRIRYVEDWYGRGEHFLFVSSSDGGKTWGLDTAYKLRDYDGEQGAVVSYQALTKIRVLQDMGIPFSFE